MKTMTSDAIPYAPPLPDEIPELPQSVFNLENRKVNWRTRKILGRPWQDLIFAAGEIVFLISLVPLLFRDSNVGAFTGLATGLMLYAFVAAQVSYRNWITVVLSLITATLWILIGLGVHF